SRPPQPSIVAGPGDRTTSRCQRRVKVWLYLFRRGSARGNEDLAAAITDLVMHPTLDSYERHVRVFARYIAQGAKTEFQYDEQSLKEVTALVSSQ
ncbi:MAG TPA: hypothetical protein VFB90_08280, partial [Dehalococcoidia bacterium]|nr:hypothetical protein [Dehalococcoidia bacterium]